MDKILQRGRTLEQNANFFSDIRQTKQNKDYLHTYHLEFGDIWRLLTRRFESASFGYKTPRGKRLQQPTKSTCAWQVQTPKPSDTCFKPGIDRDSPGVVKRRFLEGVSSEWIFRDDVTLRFSTGRQSYCIITLSRLSNKTAVILPMCIVYGYHR